MTVYLLVGRLPVMDTSFERRDTPSLILDVAESLIHKMGYKAFSYRDIARHVGIKTSSIHYHFPTKADLAAALAARWRRKMRSLLAQADASSPRAELKLEAFLEAMEQGFRQTKNICLCSMLAADFANLPEEARKEAQGAWRDAEEWLARVLDEGRTAGAFRFEGDPRVNAAVLFAALEGATISASTFQDPRRLAAMKEWIRRELLKARDEG